MLYTRAQLTDSNFEDSHVAVQRYLNKLLRHRKELKNLKWHERDFFYEHLQILIDNDGKRGFDLLKLPEAADYLLYKLVLIYASERNTIDFSRRALDYDGIIDKKRQQAYQNFFWSHLSEWFEEFETRKGIYYSVMYPQYTEKIKELKELKACKKISAQRFVQQQIYIKAAFYHTYYRARLYFDEKIEKADVRLINGFEIYADIYTFVHVITRHYFPGMNRGVGGDMNDNISGVNIRNLPSSLLDLVEKYSNQNPISKTTEYLLFSFDGVKYILWIKYGDIPSLKKKNVFEIRSFYRCTETFDMNKYNGMTAVIIDPHITIYK